VIPDRLVLCYHAVSETWPAASSVEPGRLRLELETLVERGYVGVGFTELATTRHAGRRVAVTFDDGFASVVEHAFPIMSRLGLTGTVFLPTHHIGSRRPVDWPGLDQWLGGPHERELMPMSWSDVAALSSAGWEVGSHTSTHPDLTVLDDAALQAELTDSRRVCETRLGTRCLSLAYPYGAVDTRVMTAAGRAGYRAAAALPPRIHRQHALRWPRVGVWHNDPAWLFEVKLSRSGRRRVDSRTGAMSRLPQWRFAST
jgi:peptidoglycan/xylan/chitin deacetylase (PgdA/CDA1 family)